MALTCLKAQVGEHMESPTSHTAVMAGTSSPIAFAATVTASFHTPTLLFQF